MGLYYEHENDIKISNDYWKLLVYKDLSLISNAFSHNELVLRTLSSSLYSPNNTYDHNAFALSIRAHYNTLDTISKRISNLLHNILLETPKRVKRGLLNGVGSIWKSITGNLDASDGEYYNQCIDKLEKDDAEMQKLLRNQIQIVSTTIKNFNTTVKKLQIDEQTLNEDLIKIQNAIMNFSDESVLLEKQIKIINTCESLLESYVLIESELRDIAESLTFAKLKILHPSIIKSDELINQLVIISKSLDHNNLPLQPNYNNLHKIINVISLKAFQTDKRLVFILQIPLVSNEVYSTYHLYSIPTRTTSANTFHAILPESKYIGLSKDNRQYLRLSNMDHCQQIEDGTSLCKNVIPLSLENPPCEIELITKLSTNNCKPVIMQFEDYNIVNLKKNKWIAIISSTLPIVSSCPNEATRTQLVKQSSIIAMQPKCTAYIGATQIYAEEEKSSNYSETDIIPQVPFDCCEEVKSEEPVKLKPIKINNINLDELNTAAHKLTEQEDMLNQLGNQQFATRHMSTFAILTIIAFAFIFACWCCRRCALPRRLIGYFKNSGPDDDKPSPNCCTQIFNYCNVASPITRRQSSRTSIHVLDEISFQQEGTPLSTNAMPRRSSHSSRKF